VGIGVLKAKVLATTVPCALPETPIIVTFPAKAVVAVGMGRLLMGAELDAIGPTAEAEPDADALSLSAAEPNAVGPLAEASPVPDGKSEGKVVKLVVAEEALILYRFSL
jgi:hypothetical protein